MASTGTWERCRKLACINVRAERDSLRAELSELQKKLHHLETGLRLGGEARGWRAQLIEAERALQQEKREHEVTRWRRASLTSELRASEKEGYELRNELAQVKAELSLQCKKVARHADIEVGRVMFKHSKDMANWRREKRKLTEFAEAAAAEAERAEKLMKKRDSMMKVIKEQAADSKRQATEAKRLADAANKEAAEAQQAARDAREQCMIEEQAVREAEKAKDEAEWAAQLAVLRAERARRRVDILKERLGELGVPATARSVDEWMKLSDDARRQAAHRERQHLKAFLASHPWRVSDVAFVLADLNMVKPLFDTRPFFDAYFDNVQTLMKNLQTEHYGKTFALFLHYDLHLTFSKILALSQAACKLYNHKTDRYESKPLLAHKYNSRLVINVPRVAPPASVMWPLERSIESELGVLSSEDGRLAFKLFANVLEEVLEQDAGKMGMPALDAFVDGKTRLPLVICLDATGYGRQQFNTISCRNPYMSASAQHLRTFGVGNCNDNREGSARLLGPNLQAINEMIKLKLESEEAKQCTSVTLKTGAISVRPDILVVQDLAALRHCEHIANSGWCCCSRDFALRTTPSCKPETVEQMRNLLRECHAPTRLERFIWSHSPVPGEQLPRPCSAPGCTFAHEPAFAAQELADLLNEEAQLSADQSKAGKAAFSRWRMAHARCHFNVQPGLYGRPLFEHDLSDQILDSLHYGELGVPKTPWKHGILNNSSDDARQAISDKLAEWKHPLDCRRKDDGRVRAQKWFTGEAWSSFCLLCR